MAYVRDQCHYPEKANVDYRHVSQLASAVYACFMFLYLVSGAIPAIILARSVLHKIARLEANKNGEFHLSAFRTLTDQFFSGMQLLAIATMQSRS